MNLTIEYYADADEVAEIIGNLPDVELAKLVDLVELLPELFPAVTRVLVLAEADVRALDR